jgi:AraC-like DNA-binding protein
MIPPERPSKFSYSLDKFWEAKYPESAKEIVEFAVANGLIFSRKLTIQDIRPLCVGFKHKKPSNISLHNEIFKCEINFDQEKNEVIYQPDIMNIKIPTFNPSLLEILDDFAKKTIQEQAKYNTIVSKVRTLIIRSAHTIIPLEQEIAFQMNISKRTLQKKLQEERATFKKILEEVLRELAISYLKSNKTSNKEIAWLLGYNDISNFYRAFKRWTGKTPNEFKNTEKY